ncbi:membrane protein [Gordoniibacillus kamchatkensis]|uniref:Membrane protein n=1 Tax=Gordoniibacillus kamchatkensis TaxID=1590651 RepID=A0ABR5AFQ2_9BACL|nr:hypothetical protein [Paenibacillus sp. VKM B-2647]KIL39842.1 membrane protein [Paenibacillus sp. VKM B-2647]
MNYFWSNTIWYLVLDAVTILEMTFILVRTKRRKFAFAFYLTLCGMEVLFFETVVFLLTRAYDYAPKIIQTQPFDDNLLGKVFSQLSVSATALLVAVFRLKFFWILTLSVIYALIENLFLALGVYSHNWYRTWMTPIALIAFFWGAKTYYAALLKGPKPFAHYLNIFTGLFPMFVLTILWVFSLSGYQNYIASAFPDPVIYRILISTWYFIAVSIPMMLIYFLKLTWRWKAAVIIALHGVNYLAYKKWNLLWFKDEWWYLIFSTVTIVWMYFSVLLLDYLYAKPKQQH